MKNIYGFLILILCVCFAGNNDVFARNIGKVAIDGKAFFVYEVRKGDTMFGLAHENGWDLNTLQEYNSGAISPLQKGMLLYYPASETGTKINKTLNGDKEGIYFPDYSINPLRHTVKSGETIDAISQMYGVTISDIKKQNPGIEEIFKPGITLTLADGNSIATKSGTALKFHTIQDGETLPDIAQRYNISVKALMESNPGLSAHHFITGSILKIPESGTGIKMEMTEVIESDISGFRTYKVKKDESWEEIAELNGVEPDILIASNPGIKLKKNIYVGIPVIRTDTITRETPVRDPREGTPEGITSIYKEVNRIKERGEKPEIKIALILDEPSTKKDAEYLRGFLAGIDRLKHSACKIDLNVIDGNQSSSETLAALEDYQPTIVISTAERGLPQWLTSYGEAQRTEIVNSFDVKNNCYINNPYVIQLITPSEYFNERVAQYLTKNYKGYALVFVGEKDDSDALAEALRQAWDPSRVRDRSVVDLTTLPLSANEKYLMYGYSVKKNEISEFLGAVENASQRQPMAEVNVVGRPNWIVYTDALGDKFNSAGVIIPSRFIMDKDDRRTNEFIDYYKDMYGRQLMKSFPSYGIAGFDTATYFIKKLTEARGDFNSLSESDELLQSYYTFKRPANWSGMINSGVFLLHHRPYGSVEKIILK